VTAEGSDVWQIDHGQVAVPTASVPSASGSVSEISADTYYLISEALEIGSQTDGALDITLLFAKNGELSQLWEMIQDFLRHFTINGQPLTIDLPTMASFTFELVALWISTVTTAYLAVVISAALLNGKRFNGLLSFLFFLALSWLSGWVTRQITAGMADAITTMLTYGLIDLIFAAVMYVVTALIMERKLSV